MRIGIDMGGTWIKIGLVDEEHRIVAKKSIPTVLDIPPEGLIEQISNGAKQLLDEQQTAASAVSSIGIGSPGISDTEKGIIVYSNNFHWEQVPIAAEMKRYWSCPVFLANDADTAALGEIKAGAAVGEQNAVLITLGTGVGSGVILKGRIFHGAATGGCEMGHMVLSYGGRKCTCGRQGCWEAYGSAAALLQSARQQAQANPSSLMNQLCKGDLSQMHGSVPFQAAQAGDSTAQSVLEEYFGYLSCGIVNVINTFRPSIIILGGGIAVQGDLLTKPIQKMVEEQCFGGSSGKIAQIVTSKLGNDAGIIGAANLS